VVRNLALAGETTGGTRADAARNRVQLLSTARELSTEVGVDKVTMDGLAARSGLGKGTVFRHFGSRAGIFRALLDEEERALQSAVLEGSPPLGPGAPPLERLVAYGHARVQFLFDNHAIARGSLDGGQPAPTGRSPLSRVHIRMLLGQIRPDVKDLDVLAVQLTAALDGPLLLLHLHSAELTEGAIAQTHDKLKQGWTDLINLLVRQHLGRNED
jgi:AcrR family transcriptional regulator